MKNIPFALALMFGLTLPLAAAEKVTFKPVPAALLKMDNRQVKLWNVYVAHKKAHLVLVQLGERYLMLDTGAREVLELAPQSLKRKGNELRWERNASEAQSTQTKGSTSADGKASGTEGKVLPSEEWLIRDAGRARIIRVRLKDEGRVLEVQLPLAPDQRFY